MLSDAETANQIFIDEILEIPQKDRFLEFVYEERILFRASFRESLHLLPHQERLAGPSRTGYDHDLVCINK